VKVKEGQVVKKGQELFILEAMKMENIICAEKDCKIHKIYLKKGDTTTYGQTVIELA
jgi:pyruvate carboxylase